MGLTQAPMGIIASVPGTSDVKTTAKLKVYKLFPSKVKEIGAKKCDLS